MARSQAEIALRRQLTQSYRALDLLKQIEDNEPWTTWDLEDVSQELATITAENEELLRRLKR